MSPGESRGFFAFNPLLDGCCLESNIESAMESRVTLDVDGSVATNPTAEDIARGFGSINADGFGSISMIRMRRDRFTLSAFGHPKEGYTLDLSEAIEPKGSEVSKVTSPANMIPHEQVVTVFQCFARNDDAWQVKYEWLPGGSTIPTSRVLKRLGVIVLSFVLVLAILKFVFKLI